jgi:plastocyanin
MTALMSLLAGAKAADNAESKKVEIRDRKFTPSKLLAQAGQSIDWTTATTSDHQIVITPDGKKVDESENWAAATRFKFELISRASTASRASSTRAKRAK